MDATERLRPLTHNTDLDEYLRRNMVVAKAEGVRAGLQHALIRLGKRKSGAPVWLMHLLLTERVKMEDIVDEVVKHREEIVE